MTANRRTPPRSALDPDEDRGLAGGRHAPPLDRPSSRRRGTRRRSATADSGRAMLSRPESVEQRTRRGSRAGCLRQHIAGTLDVILRSALVADGEPHDETAVQFRVRDENLPRLVDPPHERLVRLVAAVVTEA